jgi:hypothetical protein
MPLSVAQRVSLPAGSILKKLLHQKNFIPLRSAQVTKIDFRVTIATNSPDTA